MMVRLIGLLVLLALAGVAHCHIRKLAPEGHHGTSTTTAAPAPSNDPDATTTAAPTPSIDPDATTKSDGMYDGYDDLVDLSPHDSPDEGDNAPALNATQEIWRGCRARYVVRDLSDSGLDVLSIGHFSARGECRRFVKNRCRERARAAAHECMKDAWNFAPSRNPPTSCRRTWGNKRVNDYQASSPLKTWIQREACAEWRPCQPKRARVAVQAVTTGDSGCGSTRELGTMDVRC
ncbi:unnamed protein product [Vitrella brassicaformis CCMP3155]|uniref:Uncharacterized protein n=1 Tax=Vitrella brassicaformis (strain CCMP3155) TaxID=1169540 RepID=A0A0G4E9H7_VITBC|nr:unnamed protein product [Vitrella brassicaformis CCMP3155]|eukprot:CEL92038.1 unnamed protein product [Vitrella brassicaformis CCMP3155]